MLTKDIAERDGGDDVVLVEREGDVATVLRWFEVDASECGNGWSR